MKSVVLIGFLVFILIATSQAFAQTKTPFEVALDTAVQKIEEVKSKESELRSAELSRTQSQARFLPDLKISGTYAEVGKEWEDRTVLRTYGLRSNWNLFRFGGDYYFYKSADLTTESLRWDLRATKIRLEETISNKALDYISSHLIVEIGKKVTEAQRNYFNIAEKRYSKGILARQELDQITIDLKNAEARLTDNQLAEYQAKQELNVYLNDMDIPASWPWLSQLKKHIKKTLAFKVQNHPEWQFLQNKMEATEYDKKSKYSDILPSVDLSLTYANERGKITDDEWATQWLGGITLTIPLFDRLEDYTSYRQAAETKLRTDLEIQRAGRDLEAQWKVSENNFRSQLDSAIVREQTLKISNNLYMDNLRRFQAGRSTANDLLNDQERLYQSELLSIQGWKAAHASYIRLCHATGQLVTECSLAIH